MKRLPLFVSFIAVLALSASLAYWALQLLKPPQRPISAAPEQSAPEASVDAAAGLFGGQLASVEVSNYQLTGVVAAGNGRGSVAILVADGKPPQAYPVGAEIAAGVKVREVQARFVLIAEGSVLKRVELATEPAKSGADAAASGSAMPAPTAPPQMPAPSRVTMMPTPGAPPPHQ
ncbi:MAG TPA: hypothetical protein DCW29_13300 [Janthinobacterium sp.]|nr:hypothetical protein [Janthinobacterium sp.]